MKRREFFKTLILTCLVISSVILATKIWFSEELWSDGYNSFSYKSVFFSKISSLFKKETSVKSLEYNQIFFPKQLMLTHSGTVVLLKPTDDGYGELNEDIKLIFEKMFENFTVSEITSEEFKKVCKTSSVFVDFYNNTSFKMLGDYFGVKDNSETSEINNIRQLLISPEESLIYARNNLSGKIYKFSSLSDMASIAEKIENGAKSAKEGQKLYSYAFENGFDIQPEDPSAPRKMLLDPYIIINISGGSAPAITVNNLIKDKGTDIHSKLLEKFDMNINTSRPFTEADGTANYIENFAKVRIGKNGYFEYDSMNSSKGIELGEGLSSDYDIIKKAGEFLEGINAICPLPNGNEYVFNRLEKSENKYNVYFDITYNGIPVILNRNGTESNVKITVDGTKITSYKQNFIAFERAGGSYEIKNLISSLDEFYSIYDISSANDVKISDMYNTYYFNPETKDISIKCIVTLSNNEHVVVN